MERPSILADFDRDTLRAVALAYRARRQAGDLDLPARAAAIHVYRARHPDVPEGQASGVVAQMIVAAITADAAWFWRDVAGNPR